MVAATAPAGRMRSVIGVPEPVHLRELEGRDEMEALLACFDTVWGLSPQARPLSAEALLALSHAGNPVVGAFLNGAMVGASIGMCGVRSDGTAVLRSHMTGVVPTLQHAGVGRGLKLFQRRWALARRIGRIEWTFDPLVRRNGWFNLMVLGVCAPEYLVDFYGPLDDGINSGDETDRLLAVWLADRPEVTRHPEPRDILVPTPPNIVALRGRDPDAARRWRHDLRERLGPRLADGWSVVAMTSDGDYVVRPAGPTTGVT